MLLKSNFLKVAWIHQGREKENIRKIQLSVNDHKCYFKMFLPLPRTTTTTWRKRRRRLRSREKSERDHR